MSSDGVSCCVVIDLLVGRLVIRLDVENFIPFEVCDPGILDIGARGIGSLMWEVGDWNFVFECTIDMVDLCFVLAGKISSREYPMILHTFLLISSSVMGKSDSGSVRVIINNCL